MTINELKEKIDKAVENGDGDKLVYHTDDVFIVRINDLYKLDDKDRYLIS